MLRRGAVAAVCGLGLLGAAGCSSPPPPPPPTIVDLTLVTAADTNPNAAGQGAPVIVRVYQLGSAAGFDKAEFFRLLNGDAATLGADIVKRDEYLLPPGTTKSVHLEPNAQTKALGVFAAYRDFGSATWRATVPVPEHKTTAVTVRLDKAGLEASSKDASPKPGS